MNKPRLLQHGHLLPTFEAQLASATHETRKAMAELVLHKLLAYFRHGQVKADVTVA